MVTAGVSTIAATYELSKNLSSIYTQKRYDRTNAEQDEEEEEATTTIYY